MALVSENRRWCGSRLLQLTCTLTVLRTCGRVLRVQLRESVTPPFKSRCRALRTRSKHRVRARGVLSFPHRAPPHRKERIVAARMPRALISTLRVMTRRPRRAEAVMTFRRLQQQAVAPRVSRVLIWALRPVSPRPARAPGAVMSSPRCAPHRRKQDVVAPRTSRVFILALRPMSPRRPRAPGAPFRRTWSHVLCQQKHRGKLPRKCKLS